MSEVAKITFQQIGAGRAMVMIGGAAFYDGDDLVVKFKAHALDAIKSFRIALTPADLYDVTFYGRTGAVKASETGVYADQLRRIIETTTGLYLSL